MLNTPRPIAPPVLPAECLIDAYHPDNSEFMKSVNHMKQLVVVASAKCRPRHVKAAKMHMDGKSNIQIAEAIGFKPTTVSIIIHRKEVQELIALLRHYSGLWDGPTAQHKKRILWEIAQDNQKTDPKETRGAIDLLNKMDGIYTQKIDHEIKVTIDSGTFKHSVLDQ